MITEPNMQSEISRFFLILFKRKWIIVAVILLIMIPVHYYNQTAPYIYEAATQIKYQEKDYGIADVNLVPFRYNTFYIENLIHQIKSYSLMNAVIRQLPDSILVYLIPSQRLEVDNDSIDIATRRLLQIINVRALTKSDVISIKIRSENPYMAAYIANSIAETIRSHNRNELLSDVNQVRNTVEEQLTYFEQQVKSSEEALRKFKEQNKITYLDEESQEILQRVTVAETDYNQLKTNLDAAQTRFEFVKAKLKKEREDLVPSITTTTSPWATQLKEKLVDLQVQYTTLQVQNYSENHPKMVALKSQIEQTKKSLQEETLKIAQGETTIDPLSEIQKNLEEITKLEVDIHTYKAQEKALSAIIEEYNANLESLPEKELELGRLMRNKEVADKIYTSLLEKREEARIKQAEKTGNIYIIDKAQLPKSPVAPMKKMNYILGLFLSTMFGVSLALGIEVFNKKIYSINDIQNNLDINVIGTIPKITNHRIADNFKKIGSWLKIREQQKTEDATKRLAFFNEMNVPNIISVIDPKAPASEAFRSLRTNLNTVAKNGNSKIFLITGPTPEIGKSFIATNLAISNAQHGRKTLLIDTDLRKPIIHKVLNLEMQPGITDLLQKLGISDEYIEADLKKDINPKKEPPNKYQDFISSTPIKNLSVLTSGSIATNPAEILASDTIKLLITKLSLCFDTIIMDSPPVLAVPDALFIAPVTDGILFITRADKNSLKEVTLAKKLVDRIRDNLIIGVVLNDIDKREDYYTHYYYRTQQL